MGGGDTESRSAPLIDLLFALGLTLEGWRVAVLSAETTPFLHYPKSIAYGSMPLAGLVMIADSLSGIHRALSGLWRKG